MDTKTVLDIARSEIGYMEKSSTANLDSKTAGASSGNYTKYWRDMNPAYQGQPWCNAFVNWCFVKAYGEKEAKRLLCTDSGWSYYTPTSAQYFKNKNQWHSTPKAGDIIYFKNSSRIHHVGIVSKVDATRVYTIEGNTSSGTAVIANGGEVAQKSYLLGNSSIAGYGRPAYEAEAFVPHWEQVGDLWYYRIAEGQNAHGWKLINHHWYWFEESGAMVTDWCKIGADWYYFQPSGDLEGALYRSDENGAQSIWGVE